MAPSTMDLLFIIKKEQGEYSIIKHPTTTFSILFSSLKNKNEEQNNPSSDVVVTEDDHVCLHFSVGDPSCPSCDYQQQQQQQLTTNNKKRKLIPQQQTLKNKKARINWVLEEEEDDHSICLHLLLGSSSCMPTCCNHIAAADDDHHDDRWEMKKVLEKSDVCLHSSRLLISKDVAKKFVIPVLLGRAEAAKSKEGVELQVRDVDTDTLHSLVFKYWVSAKSHIFTKRWVKDFVHRRELKKGDQIGLRWDQEKNRFEFSVVRRAEKVVE